MFPSPWRKFILPILLISQFLTLSTAVGLSQSPGIESGVTATNSSITICLDNGLHPDPITFNGDLGSFTLSGPNDCRSSLGLNAGSYAISETLPSGWFSTGIFCQEKTGAGTSQWQTTPQSVVVELAESADVNCRFSSLANPDEPNDTMAQATPTNYGGTVIAAIGPHPDVGPDGDVDFYRFHGYGGDTLSVDADVYWFWINGGDPHLTLRDGGGQIIAQVVGTGSPFLHLEHKLPETADYYLEMWVDCSNYNSSCEGEYGWYLGIIDPYEPNDSPQAAAPINFNDILRGFMDNDDGDPIVEKDADYFYFQGKAGDEVIIEVSRFNDETVPDCTLQDASETILASHFGPTCRIEHTLAADGQYTINVFSQFHEGLLNAYWRGPYQLSLRYKNVVPVALPDSYNGYAGQSMAIAAPGVLENDTDADGDPLTAVLTTDAQHGDLVLAGDGYFTYKPEPGFIGEDAFQYHADDGRDSSESVTVTITIDPQTHYLPVVHAK